MGDAQAGDYVCRVGRPVTYWFGVVEGLLKMSSDSADGQTMTFTGVPPGGWFGEGTALKREVYRYNIQALRRSVVAGIPVDTFHWLLDHSIGFNRFVMNQLNERLGQFIAAREIDRMNTPELRVARNLASLFNPVLYPGVGEVLREEFLAPLSLSVNALALALRVPATRIHEIVKERRGISPDTAERLARYFGGDAASWLSLQASFDLKTLPTRDEILQGVQPRDLSKRIASA